MRLCRARRAVVRAAMFLFASSVAAGSAAGQAAAERPEILAVDGIGARGDLAPAADILSVALERDPSGTPWLRVSVLSLATDPAALTPVMGRERAAKARFAPTTTVTVVATRSGDEARLTCALERRDGAYRPAAGAQDVVWRADDPDAVRLRLPARLLAGATAGQPVTFTIGTEGAELVTASYPADKAYAANCALVLHGNQGLGYSDVFVGRGDDPEGSGFDEALQAHQAAGVPGNFHLSGTLQASAQWSRANGDPLDFNGWLAAGVSAGWAGMVTSAFSQHIMPFVRNEMNDWAVNTESDMIALRYGYTPRVAWVPERVWLNTSGYPSAGVSDWIGDNFQPHGVWGVILDDDVHLTGHDNHQIHSLAANGLRLIPRDRAFTGDIIGGNGAAALGVLTGLASSGVGEYRIAVFAEDWEAVAEMGSWATVTPNAKETYDWFVDKCRQESAWLSTWKLADALANPNFNGSSINVTPGTYTEIGGTGGYGGGDNGWYGHWAGWVGWANGGNASGTCAGTGGNCKNYGQLWNDAYNALMAAPDNNISQAGWYVLLSNLHETAWHDGLVGPISGWQHFYSAHIRQAMVYAEAARWAAGLYTTTTAAFLADVDDDGFDEAVMHNDRLFAVFESIGGRATHVFVKGPGHDDSAIGSDHTTWNTEGDYNDANHVGALSDVSPNYQHDLYAISVVAGTGPTAKLRLSRGEVTKEVSLTGGDQFLDVVYRVGPTDHWLQSGFAPSLVDLTWNAQLSRVWVGDQAYMGQRNPNTGIAAAWVLGAGGAAHQRDFSGTLMKGDEIRGRGTFQARLFAGQTSAPGPDGEIAELRALATSLTDAIGPGAVAADWYPGPRRLRVQFDQEAVPGTVAPAGFGLDDDADGVAEVTLAAGATVVETVASFQITLTVDAATAAAIDALAPGDVRLLVAANSVRDVNGVGNVAVSAADHVVVTAAPPLKITIDGWLDPEEWWGVATSSARLDLGDSEWTASNEIDRLRYTYDDQYLYLAIDGRVQGNSWLLYVDVDPGSANGQADLTAINAWERGATFTAPGFRPDFQYGCYQHQSLYDGDGFWQLTSPTTTVDRSGEVLRAFDSLHVHGDEGGSEIAIPWHTLYGLGEGIVPANARVAIVASLCWDPEPGGALGGDVVPDNVAATLPVVDNCWTFPIYADSGGHPVWPAIVEVPDAATPALRLGAAPNPFNPATVIRFELPGAGPVPFSLAVYDVRGHRVRQLARGELNAGAHVVRWDGADHGGRPVASGNYVCVLESRGRRVSLPLSLVR